MERALDEANRAFQASLVVPLAVTLGDEWQRLFRSSSSALEAELQVRTQLHPVAVRSGIGVGALSTSLRPTTATMDGDCFHRAREAVEAARRRRLPGVVVVSGDPLLDAGANAACGLLAALLAGWTEKQLRSVVAYRRFSTEKAAAQALGVAQPTLHQSLEGARGKEFVEGLARLLEFLRLREEETGRTT
jgi:hypothetical protein